MIGGPVAFGAHGRGVLVPRRAARYPWALVAALRSPPGLPATSPMKFHWKVLLWMLAGALVGVLLRNTLASPSSIGGSWRSVEGGRLELVEVVPGGPLARAGIAEGAVLLGHVADRGLPSEALVPAGDAEAFARFVEDRSTGTSLWLQLEEGAPRQVTVELEPGSTLAQVLAPIDFFAEVFKDLLKMLIVPIVFTSIVTGVAGVGT